MTGPVEYTHDALGSLSAAVYADGRVDLRMPDAVGNLFRTSDRSDRTYGPAGQLLEARDARGITRYEYDAEGNLVQKCEPGGRVWTYRWNGAGMLAQVVRPDGDSVEFSYDALARRISKKYRDKTTRWIWDGHVPLHEWVERDTNFGAAAADASEVPSQSESAAEVRAKTRLAYLSAQPAQGPPGATRMVSEGTKDAPITWVFEPGTFAPLAKIVDGERYGIVTDHLGTPTGMFDGSGTEVWAADISAYGELRNVRGVRAECPFRWPGQYEDEETGLYYNRLRYYSPDSGAFVSLDPLGWLAGLRPTAYMRCPELQADPLGLMDPWDIQFSQDSIGNTFTDRNSSWFGRTLDEAIEEARLTGRLPEGLTLGVQEFGDGSVVALNNGTLFVAQQAGINVNPVFRGAEADNQMRKLLDGHGPLPLGEQPEVRCG